MEKWKEIMSSEQGMKIVNGMFMLSFFIPGGVIVTSFVWLIYLVFCIKKSDTKIMKGIYGLLVLFACWLIAVNIYGLVTSL